MKHLNTKAGIRVAVACGLTLLAAAYYTVFSRPGLPAPDGNSNVVVMFGSVTNTTTGLKQKDVAVRFVANGAAQVQSTDGSGNFSFTSPAVCGGYYFVSLSSPEQNSPYVPGIGLASITIGVCPPGVAAEGERMGGLEFTVSMPERPSSPPGGTPPLSMTERTVEVGMQTPSAPGATDSRFVTTLDGALWSGGIHTINLPVKRMVSNADQLGARGNLLFPEKMVNSGGISKEVTLRIAAYDVDPGVGPKPEVDRVIFNGTDIGTLKGSNEGWNINEFHVPVELVRFGHYPIKDNGEPTSGDNVIEISVDEAGGDWIMAPAWAELSFTATYPTIMVHGNYSTNKFWEGDYDGENGVPNGPDDDSFNFFVAPFREAGLPYDNSINMVTDRIGPHGNILTEKIPVIAKRFGVKHVNLVGHSKGGLDLRDFLVRVKPLQMDLGVLSLSTLSTPHHGSAGADYCIDAQNVSALLSTSMAQVFRIKAAQRLGTNAGHPDLRVSGTKRFNDGNLKNLPRDFVVDGERNLMTYFALSADANVDNSQKDGHGTISVGEVRGTAYEKWQWNEASVVADARAFGGQIAYDLLGNVASTKVVPITVLGLSDLALVEDPTTTFEENDLAVTKTSARLPEAAAIEAPPQKRNHALMSHRDIALIVINYIRSLQPIREE